MPLDQAASCYISAHRSSHCSAECAAHCVGPPAMQHPCLAKRSGPRPRCVQLLARSPEAYCHPGTRTGRLTSKATRGSGSSTELKWTIYIGEGCSAPSPRAQFPEQPSAAAREGDDQPSLMYLAHSNLMIRSGPWVALDVCPPVLAPGWQYASGGGAGSCTHRGRGRDSLGMFHHHPPLICHRCHTDVWWAIMSLFRDTASHEVPRKFPGGPSQEVPRRLPGGSQGATSRLQAGSGADLDHNDSRWQSEAQFGLGARSGPEWLHMAI